MWILVIQNVFYITERAVFKLAKDGIILIEVAPGVDIEKDIIMKMEFNPIISDRLIIMNSKYFNPEW